MITCTDALRGNLALQYCSSDCAMRTAAVRALEGDAPASVGEDGEQPRATELAAQCPNAVSEMRQVLRRQGWTVPCERYAFEDDGPELMRCAAVLRMIRDKARDCVETS